MGHRRISWCAVGVLAVVTLGWAAFDVNAPSIMIDEFDRVEYERPRPLKPPVHHVNIVIARGDSVVGETPRADFLIEIKRIALARPPQFRVQTRRPLVLVGVKEAWLTPTELDRQQGKKGFADFISDKADNHDEQYKRRLAYVEPYVKQLEAALAETSLPAAQKKQLTTHYSLSRIALAIYAHRMDRWRRSAGGRKPKTPRPDRLSSLVIPKDLPVGFSEYLRGAIAFHEDRTDDAIAAWRKVLASGCKQRSTWAAHMIGRALIEKDPKASAAAFAQVRVLAGKGSADPLDLAADSYGLEARAHLNGKQYAQAINLYLLHNAAGSGNAIGSLRTVCEAIFTAPAPKSGPRDQSELVKLLIEGDIGTRVPTRVIRRAGRNIGQSYHVVEIDDETSIIIPKHEDLDPEILRMIRHGVGPKVYCPPEPVLASLAADARARAVVTAWVLTGGQGSRVRPDKAIRRGWLKAMDKAPSLSPGMQARMAWLAWQSGDFKAVGRWVRKGGQTHPVTRWIGAKLAVREGKRDQAATILASLLDEPALDRDWNIYAGVQHYKHEPFNLHRQIAGELAFLHAAAENYEAALVLAMAKGYWADAAFVAERLMTVEELKAYVDAHCPAGRPTTQPASQPAVLKPVVVAIDGDVEMRLTVQADGSAVLTNMSDAIAAAGGGDIWIRQEPTSPSVQRPIDRVARVRYLLARRLVRIGQCNQARAYMPAKWHKDLKTYGAGLAALTDARAAKAPRGNAIWLAASVAKTRGMEIMGTELGPDWTVCNGRASFIDPVDARANHTGKWIVPPSPDQLSRLARSAPQPNRRFHYRWRAASLAWVAATLMPDESEQTAKVLATTVEWMKNDDPVLAQKFRQTLINRCRTTAPARRFIAEQEE